jgi:hypothetical protein
MNYRLPAVLLGCAAAFAAGATWADITGVRSMPRQATLVAGGGTMLSVNWQVSTTPDHGSGVTSATSQIVDPTTGMVLQGTRAPLSADGGGPFLLREVIALDDATVRSWLDQGLRRVVLERAFFDPATGSTASGTVVLSLSASRLQSTREAAPAELTIASLRLEFDSGSNTAVTSLGDPLRAALTVQYSGSGMLQGRWQIAEPDSSEGAPLFRTMALVNTKLHATQESRLQSPPLPTQRAGKYLVRFCITSREAGETAADAHCPDPDLLVVATYHVQEPAESVGTISGISPDRQAVSASTPFSWRPVQGAVVYQLQIFEGAGLEGLEPTGRAPAEPRFVAGMLLDAGTSSTPLSELARSKLRPGQRYRWRVTAHDDAGQTLGASAEANFVYRPDG